MLLDNFTDVFSVGIYTRGCSELRTFLEVCVGCGDTSQVRVVAMLDTSTDCGRLGRNVWIRSSITQLRLLLRQEDQEEKPLGLLSEPGYDWANKTRALSLALSKPGVYWAKTRALFSLQAKLVPLAKWYLKIDADTLLNLVELSRLLSTAAGHSTAVDYLGSPSRKCTPIETEASPS